MSNINRCIQIFAGYGQDLIADSEQQKLPKIIQTFAGQGFENRASHFYIRFVKEPLSLYQTQDQ